MSLATGEKMREGESERKQRSRLGDDGRDRKKGEETDSGRDE